MSINPKKVWLLPPEENWIVDEMCKVWSRHNADMTIGDPRSADVIWVVSDWCWRRVPTDILSKKKVVTTIHHIVPSKWNREEFLARDRITDVYHVPNKHTHDFIIRHTTKPIVMIPYWCDQEIWKQNTCSEPVEYSLEDDGRIIAELQESKTLAYGQTYIEAFRNVLRAKYYIPFDAYVVGSFQRDSEGTDISKPKLEKGPDFFADACIKLRDTKYPNLHVLLTGWRRDYLIDRLKVASIPNTSLVPDRSHLAFVNQQSVNEAYQCLDLYMVTSRYEGGPQAFLEAGALGIPVVSRDVGMASAVLPPSAINDDVTLAHPCVPDIEHLKLPQGFEAYRRLFQDA